MNSKASRSDSRLRIVVLGYIVRGPLGGLTWHHLQYVMGLSQLGHDVYFVEDSDDYPSCYDPTRHVTDENPTYGLQFAKETLERVGLGERWAFYNGYQGTWHGSAARRILEICATADIVFNLSGVNPMRSWMMRIPTRVYVDTDPVFTQIRILRDPEKRDLASLHTTFVSFGENIGQADCTIPDDGLLWKPTRQPVVLDAWPITEGQASGKFTTVMQWNSYPKATYNGISYGMKSDSFETFLDIPKQCNSVFELALGGETTPATRLEHHGWIVRNPLELTKDPWTYQSYIRASKGEFSIAKHGYVVSKSGWFSERSTSYLASGRPVVVQETGFSRWLKAGYGVISFETLEQALNGIEEINSRYEFHCRNAREIAGEYFDSRKVLADLIDQVTDSTQNSFPSGDVPRKAGQKRL